jgi:hypothetical protein
MATAEALKRAQVNYKARRLASDPVAYREQCAAYSQTFRKKQSRERLLATYRRYQLKSKYGLTVEAYDVMLAKQNGVCAICGSKNPRGPGKRLHIDHDHATGKVRGLLCHPCNRALGLVRDSPALLRKAATYLEETS